MENINAVGRRKAAVARVILKEGTGVITINKRPLEVYFPSSILQFIVKQPLPLLTQPRSTTYMSISTAAVTRVRRKHSVSASPVHL